MVPSVFRAVVLLLFAMPFDPAPWLEDFAQLQSEMSAHYANLDWAVAGRHMDLRALREVTEAKLRAAKSDAEARTAMERFVHAFGDGHLQIAWPKVTDSKPAAAPARLCDRLDFKSVFSPGIVWSKLSGFTPVAEGAFPSGLLRLAPGKVLGVIRVSVFSERAFPSACEQALRSLHLEGGASCDSDCADSIERVAADLLTADIERRAGELRARGAQMLAVDITGNGGGSNWVEAIARILSRVPLRQPRLALLKHPHWVTQLQDLLRDVEADLQGGAAPRPVLEEAAARLRRGIMEARAPCDRAGVWRTGKLECSMLMDDVLFMGGLLPYAKPGMFVELRSRTHLFHPLHYAYTESTHRLPLYVLVDRNTWSAAEYFAAVLQDARAAVVVGEVSGGAGCGYTDGGIPTVLTHSEASVKMPDCARLRRDRSNEVDGVTPDILVPWAEHDSEFAKADKLRRALLGAWSRRR